MMIIGHNFRKTLSIKIVFTDLMAFWLVDKD